MSDFNRWPVIRIPTGDESDVLLMDTTAPAPERIVASAKGPDALSALNELILVVNRRDWMEERPAILEVLEGSRGKLLAQSMGGEPL
jgi:hypothetical protein